MQKIKVLHCLYRVGSGGVEQRRLSLARRLDRERYEQHLVCTKAVGGLPAEFEKAGCIIHEVGEFNGILDRRPYKATLEVVRELRPHIIHGAVYEGVALAAVAGRFGRVPVVVGEETVDPKYRRVTGHLLYRALCSMTHHLVAISPAVHGYLADRIYNPDKKITLINNGVEERQRPNQEKLEDIKNKHGIGDDKIVIGTVGRLLDKHKRVSDLIRVLPRVLEHTPEACLLIVGGGPDEDELKQLAVTCNVAHATIFAGYQADTAPYYAVMDIFALVSEYEGLPLVVLEAMFAQLPVVATSVGGTPSVVNDNNTGFLLNPGDAERLADSLFKLLRSAELRRAMGIKGQERARSEFSAERYVSDVDKLYQRLLAEWKVT
ncbi:glycosyltransferase [Marinobacter sp. HL-58]|uniref:glycosyltransferase n=1 Tax=Marinobacter sp. HL-58 TaxID=1479237 RepID=UPI000488909E|nr:glycosyltransferase [Marinobacter sp. HL-58]KPP97785.1 MAG: GT4 family glycosyl transferase [Marinobacter sp. HL-58]